MPRSVRLFIAQKAGRARGEGTPRVRSRDGATSETGTRPARPGAPWDAGPARPSRGRGRQAERGIAGHRRAPTARAGHLPPAAPQPPALPAAFAEAERGSGVSCPRRPGRALSWAMRCPWCWRGARGPARPAAAGLHCPWFVRARPSPTVPRRRTLVPGASQWPQTVRSQTAELTIMRDVKTARGTLTRPQLLVTVRSGAGHTVAVTFGSVVLTYDILNVELPNSSRL